MRTPAETEDLKRDSEILAYVRQTLNEHGAPTHDSEGRKLNENGRLVDFLAARRVSPAELEKVVHVIGEGYELNLPEVRAYWEGEAKRVLAALGLEVSGE